MTTHPEEIIALERIQIVRKRRIGNAELRSQLARGHSARMSREQEPDEPQSRFGAQGLQHPRISGNGLGINICLHEELAGRAIGEEPLTSTYHIFYIWEI